MSGEINLTGFYPEYMKIDNVENTDSCIRITMRSITETAICPVCRHESSEHRSFAYKRNIQDLPVLGKPVHLDIAARMYACTNDACQVIIFNEHLRDFVGIRRQMTERCEAFVMALALNTSCEATSVLCKRFGINISGDTVIRTLLRNIREEPYIGESIGVDDWAYRKGQSYGTLICDTQTGKPIALLPGRDGSALKDWLRNNRQIKTVTRDRASSYASAIAEVIPEAVQIADRFHLFQNLLLAIKETVRSIIPERIRVQTESDDAQEAKKNHAGIQFLVCTR